MSPVLALILVLPLLISCGSTAVQYSQLTPTTTLQGPLAVLPTPTLMGTPGVPAYSYKMIVLGVVVDGNNIVLQVEKDSGAEKAGIEVGDEIKAVNNIDIKKDMKNGKDQVRLIHIGDKVKVKLKKTKKTDQTSVATTAQAGVEQTDQTSVTTTAQAGVEQTDEVEVEVVPSYQGSSPNGETPTPVFPPNDYM